MKNIIFSPRCDSSQVVKNGLTHNKNQNNKCKKCNRQLVLNPRKKVIGEEKKLNKQVVTGEAAKVRELLESPRCQTRWLQIYVNKLYQSIAKEVESKQNQWQN